MSSQAKQVETDRPAQDRGLVGGFAAGDGSVEIILNINA